MISLCELFIATPGQWRQHVIALRDSLFEINIPLRYMEVDNFSEISEAFSQLVEKYEIFDVYVNKHQQS